MKRHEHQFQFTGKQISAAAWCEYTYHDGRLTYWKEAQELAIKKAKDAGVDIREYDVTGGKRVEMVIDPTLTTRLNECASKVQSHRAAADKFKIEAECYGTQEGRVYELHPDDVVYFRLAGGSRDN